MSEDLDKNKQYEVTEIINHHPLYSCSLHGDVKEMIHIKICDDPEEAFCLRCIREWARGEFGVCPKVEK